MALIRENNLVSQGLSLRCLSQVKLVSKCSDLPDAIARDKISKCWIGRQAETVGAFIRIFQISWLRAYLKGC